MATELSKDILKYRRKYFTDIVKAPLIKILVELCKLYPEATKENTGRRETHILIDIKDLFFKYENNAGRKALFEALWRVFIAEYEHDPYYRHRIDWIIDEIKKRDWTPRVPTRPSRGLCWKEPLEGYEWSLKDLRRFGNI